ncbi:MAG: hypothetical protein AAGH15_17295 [Myxococcota bacterium]
MNFARWGARFGLALLTLAVLTPVPACSVEEEAAICTNTCRDADDGFCDDSGPGADFSICALGTDCNDCGVRFCTNTCEDADDGFCDDGGPGSDFSICEFGTDCGDCGVR